MEMNGTMLFFQFETSFVFACKVIKPQTQPLHTEKGQIRAKKRTAGGLFALVEAMLSNLNN